MSDTVESYPTPTVPPKGIPVNLQLSGTGISKAAPAGEQGSQGGAVYAVTLSSPAVASPAHPTSVSVTASLFDGQVPTIMAVTSSPETFTAASFNAKPSTSSGTQESYPAPNAQVGRVAIVSAVTNNGNGTASFTVTAEAAGQAVVEAQYPVFGNTEAPQGAGNSVPLQNDCIYAQLLVNVVNQ